MAALLDFDNLSTLEPVDNSLAISATVFPNTLTQGVVKLPVLSAVWVAPVSNYVLGIQFEYGPSDLSSGSVLTDVQRKEQLSWSSPLLVAGKSYTGRYRAVGLGVFGAWIPFGPIVMNTDFVAGATETDPFILDEISRLGLSALQRAIEAAQAQLEADLTRDIAVRDLLDRLSLGFALDPITRSAIIKTETIAQGIGPGGLPETLVQMTTRLVAADAANTAATAQAILTARAYTDTKSAQSIIGLATVTQLNSSISTAQGQWQSYANAAAAGAIVGLDTVAARVGALATAKGQWESYATDAAANAVIGLASTAQLTGQLATAKGQWEAYANAAAASATVGLDTVVLRNAAIAANTLSLQSYVNDQIATSTATLASQASLNGVSATAALALTTAATADGKASSIIGFTQNVNGLLTGVVSTNNGVTSAVRISSDAFSIEKPGGGARTEFSNGNWRVYDASGVLRVRFGVW